MAHKGNHVKPLSMIVRW